MWYGLPVIFVEMFVYLDEVTSHPTVGKCWQVDSLLSLGVGQIMESIDEFGSPHLDVLECVDVLL